MGSKPQEKGLHGDGDPGSRERQAGRRGGTGWSGSLCREVGRGQVRLCPPGSPGPLLVEDKKNQQTQKSTLLLYSMEHPHLSAVLNQTQKEKKEKPREFL